jgi:ligand-binding sensor domain-containing protein/two-component sensor histidine kinase
MKNLGKVILMTIMCAEMMHAHSQQPVVKPLKFEALTINEGLSQGMVMSILQDRYGFMWFGTKEGLNRYDGYHFKVFRNVPGDSSTISNNYVQWVYEDQAGRLWAGTVSGLNLFDRGSETFRRVMAGTGRGALAQGNVSSITEDKDCNLLVVQDKVIDRLTLTEKDGALHVDVIHSVPLSFSFIELLKRRDGSFYLSSIANGLFRINMDSFPKVRTEAITSSLRRIGGKADSIPKGGYRLIVNDALNDVVYFANDKNLLRVDAAGKISVVCEDCTQLSNFSVYSLIDSAGTLLTTLDRMLLQVNTRTGKYERFVAWDHNHNNALGHIFVLYKDRSGMLWVGSNGFGLLKHNPFSEKFHHTDHYSISRMRLGENGSVIVNDDFISKERFDTDKMIVYDPAAAKNIKHYGRGFTEISFPKWRTKESVWFTDESCLFCYNRISGVMDSCGLPGAPPWNVQSIYDDEKQFVWLGTGEGVLRFNVRDKTWKQYRRMPGDTASLRSDAVLCVVPHAKHDDYLWAGTDGGGLHLMDTKSGKFTAYTTADGLPNDVVYGVLNDDDGNVWVSTNKGLSRFNPEKNTFKNFEEKDGLQSNEFNRGAYCKTSDGWLFFGGVNGFNFFNPKEMSDNKFIPQTLITDLKIRNKPVSFSDEKSPLSQPVYLSNEITLPYSENMISFEFASMDFTAPAKNMFQYKMDGFDESWIHSGNNHSATYTNLDPGSYTFKVKSSNHDGVWNEAGTYFTVTILPPWYMTWWFRMMVVSAIACLVYFVYRYRLSHALKLQEVRNRIAQDLHDEIGSNLSTISIFTDMAIKKSKSKSESVNALLTKINDYTQTSMEAMSDIVWMINSRNDRFENMIVHMRTHAAELFEAKGFELHMRFDENLNSVKMGMSERKNFYLIYKEALNNIVKYAGGKNVWIEMKLDHGTIQLKIMDDGKGFETAGPARGNGLVNMRRRAELLKGSLSIESAEGAGTTIALKFAV